jgi:hypothetical protein
VKKGHSIKVLAELRDLEIFDSEELLCGIADDVEFEGAPGGPLVVKALLVGPGAYQRRLPGFLLAIIWRLTGKDFVRVPWSAVEHVTSRITLNEKAEKLGLGRTDQRVRRWLPPIPAL